MKIFLVSYVGERPWWSMQSPNEGRKTKERAKRRERSEQVTEDKENYMNEPNNLRRFK